MIRAYLRVSTVEQADSGLGIAAQRRAVEHEAERRGWPEVTWYVDAGASGRTLDRPEVVRLLAEVSRGDVVVVAKLDRLSRSLVDAVGLLETSQRRGWSLVALDLGVDTSTATGRLVASVMAAVAAWEREIIGQRTRDAMAQAKARGQRLGRRSAVPVEVQERIEAWHLSGWSMRVIAERLTVQGVPTSTGAERWYPSSVSGVLSSRANDRLAGLVP